MKARIARSPWNCLHLGVYAQPLRFLDYAIQAAALYRSGVLVNIPQPPRYAVHKIIVAARRTTLVGGGRPVLAQTVSAKARKDIEQAAALIRMLAGGPS